ncbi:MULTISPECIES: helix-turn-helix domain-containing protein [Bacillota]|uniref:helix-turn-helix domain-containing protein n=1 Tax=Bacillota TaxID=1239 RepID=UPI00257052CF|nr:MULTISPECIES: helix-turn-helix transcriptional regulator [Bacillota]
MIKKQRLLLRISQKKLASKLGISRSYLSKIENKKFRNVKLSLLKNIANELNIDLNDLLEWFLDK